MVKKNSTEECKWWSPETPMKSDTTKQHITFVRRVINDLENPDLRQHHCIQFFFLMCSLALFLFIYHTFFLLT